ARTRLVLRAVVMRCEILDTRQTLDVRQQVETEYETKQTTYMIDLKQLEVWFLAGSQHLYGEETLKQAAAHAEEIARHLDHAQLIPVKIVFKPIVKTSEEIYAAIASANQTPTCIGIITWMHTFSPGKMWIRGLGILQKPLLHLH